MTTKTQETTGLGFLEALEMAQAAGGGVVCSEYARERMGSVAATGAIVWTGESPTYTDTYRHKWTVRIPEPKKQTMRFRGLSLSSTLQMLKDHCEENAKARRPEWDEDFWWTVCNNELVETRNGLRAQVHTNHIGKEDWVVEWEEA